MRFCPIPSSVSTYGVVTRMGKALAVMACLAGPALAEAPVTVLALGDSLTQGYGLPQEEGFVPQLRDWLTDHGVAAQIVNGGVSGDTTAGGAARVDWSLTPEVDAMIVALGGNDLLRGIEPDVARGNLERILQAAKANAVEVLLVGMDAPGNYGAAYKTDFDAIYPESGRGIWHALRAGFLRRSRRRHPRPNCKGIFNRTAFTPMPKASAGSSRIWDRMCAA